MPRRKQGDRVIAVPGSLARTRPANAPPLRATVMYCVETDDSLSRVRLVESSGEPLYDATVVEAVNQWQFEHGTVNGKPGKFCINEIVGSSATVVPELNRD